MKHIWFLIFICFSLQACAASPSKSGSSDPGLLDQIMTATGDFVDDMTGSNLNPQEQFAKVWEEAYPRLDDLLAEKERHKDLPESKWFGEDQKSHQKEIDALLQEAVKILGLSAVSEDVQVIKNLENTISQKRRQMAEYQTKKISRPGKAKSYDDKIADLKGDIAENKTQIKQHKANIAQHMQKTGVYLSEAQLDVLMTSVVGDDVIAMSVVFDNVKQISNHLAQLMIDNGEDLEFARKHYGMYAVLLEVVITMQQNFIDRIVQNYLPKLEKIRTDNQRLQQKTQNMLMRETDALRRSNLQISIQAQKLTSNTLNLYRQQLTRQANQVLKAQGALKKDYDVALIRYQTVRISGELVTLIRASNQQFSSLANLQLPELVPFENMAMRAEFEKLTTELRQAE